ncbi:TolC family protein [Thermocrinis minervae]|uniref:Outer membrane protein TolC n=1 Tax=Thermocrinis minervae TaxID=381751 RepID=A0A1M6TI81_9AQUI|nr:TolC family protein [Thermocrinis minervae]SHK56593.1 Outer membrane protein TolC [Thermocrinis minervae]
MMFLLLLFLLGISYAISLEEAVEVALKNNTSVRISELDIRKAEQAIRQARAGILPQVNLSYSYTRLSDSLAYGFTPKDRQSYLIGLNQTIFDRSIFTAITLAKDSMELKKLVHEDVKRTVEYQVKSLFYALLYKKKVVELLKENLSYWEENYKLAQAKYQAGILTKVDLIRTQAQLESAKAALEQAKTDYIKSLEDFKNLLKVDSITEPEGELSYSPFDKPLDILQEELLKNNSTLKVERVNYRVLQRQVELAKASYYPTLSANLGYQGSTGKKSFSGGTQWIEGYTAGVSLNYKIFDGFARDANVAQAQIDLLKEAQNLKDVESTQLTLLRKAYDDLQSLKTQIDATLKSLEASKEALRLSTERYRYGITTLLEVLDARNNYNTTLQNLYLLYYNYNSTLALIERLTR